MFYSHQAFEFLSAKYKETDFSDELLGMMFKKITELKIDKSDISESEFISHFEMENASRIAKILNIGRTTAYALVKEGHFKTVRIGSAIRISKQSFDEWLDRQEF